MSDDKGNLILFPTNRIVREVKNEKVKHPVDPKTQTIRSEEQTTRVCRRKPLMTLHMTCYVKFVDAWVFALRKMTFTADLGTCDRWNQRTGCTETSRWQHPAQQLGNSNGNVKNYARRKT